MGILPPTHPARAAIVCDSSHISSLTPHTLRGRHLRGDGLRGAADLPKVTQLAKEKLKFPLIFTLPKDKGLSHFMCRYGGHWQTHSNHSETVIPVMLVTRPRVSSIHDIYRYIYISPALSETFTSALQIMDSKTLLRLSVLPLYPVSSRLSAPGNNFPTCNPLLQLRKHYCPSSTGQGLQWNSAGWNLCPTAT